MYRVELSIAAQSELKKLQKSEPLSIVKLKKLIEELASHPTTGTGHPEQLKGLHIATWSRRISKKHRIVYEIHEMQVRVLVISLVGHYDDK